MIATYYARNKKCYRHFGPVKTFPKARKHCVDLGPGGELASIPDEETQTFLLEEIANSFWTGGTADDGLTGVSWRWLDGTPWSFEDWRTFHPKVGIDQRLFWLRQEPNKSQSSFIRPSVRPSGPSLSRAHNHHYLGCLWSVLSL